jgi:hypothetical protein
VRTAIILSLLLIACSIEAAPRRRATGGPTDLQIACFVFGGNTAEIDRTIAYVYEHRDDGTIAPFFRFHVERVMIRRPLYQWLVTQAYCAPISPSYLGLDHFDAYEMRESVEIVNSVRIK